MALQTAFTTAFRSSVWVGGWGLEAETLAYLAFSGVSLTTAQIAALDASNRAIKSGTPVTLSSVTLDMSTSATGFITNSSVDLRPYSSTVWGGTALQITVNDGTNDFTLTPGAAGTGETYSAALNTSSCVNVDYTTFDGASATGFHVVSNGAEQHEAGTADEIPYTAGMLLKTTFTEVLASGTAPRMIPQASLGSGNVGPNIATANGANTYIATITSTTTGVFTFYNQLATEFTISNLLVRKILTPSTTGLVFTNGSGALFTANLAGDGPYSITVELAP